MASEDHHPAPCLVGEKNCWLHAKLSMLKLHSISMSDTLLRNSYSCRRDFKCSIAQIRQKSTYANHHICICGKRWVGNVDILGVNTDIKGFAANTASWSQTPYLIYTLASIPLTILSLFSIAAWAASCSKSTGLPIDINHTLRPVPTKKAAAYTDVSLTYPNMITVHKAYIQAYVGYCLCWSIAHLQWWVNVSLNHYN